MMARDPGDTRNRFSVDFSFDRPCNGTVLANESSDIPEKKYQLVPVCRHPRGTYRGSSPPTQMGDDHAIAPSSCLTRT